MSEKSELPCGVDPALRATPYRVEDRTSPISMGVQRRIVGPRFAGPWVECGTTSEAWRAYKLARRSKV